MNPFCLPNTVPVPEEHQDFPGSVQWHIRDEEKRAVRGLWPFWRQGLWKGKTGLLCDTCWGFIPVEESPSTLTVFAKCQTEELYKRRSLVRHIDKWKSFFLLGPRSHASAAFIHFSYFNLSLSKLLQWLLAHVYNLITWCSYWHC